MNVARRLPLPRGTAACVCVIALLAIGSSCREPTAPAAGGDLVLVASAKAVEVPLDKPLGIGGSYTLNVSGPYVTFVPPSPSGLMMFPGIPVQVEVTGQITREMTDGFLAHCELLPFTCPDFIKSNAPFGPGGLGFTSLGAATSWWDFFFGYYYYVSPGGNLVYRGPSGVNLLLGRTGLYCSWGEVDVNGNVTEGDCYNMGGGFTYTIHTIPTPRSAAGLTLAITRNGMGPDGGPVDLTAATTDDSPASQLTWYFIADVVSEATEPVPLTTAAWRAASAPAGLVPSGPSRSVSASGKRSRWVRAINAATRDTTITSDVHTLPAGRYLFLGIDSIGTGLDVAAPAPESRTPFTASRGMSLSPASVARDGSPLPYPGDELPAPITGSARLDGCAGSLTCSVNLRVPGGTFVVTGIVRNALRAAEQRVKVTDAPPSPDKKLHVVIEPEADGLMEFSRHINAPNCQAEDVDVKRQFHLFVIDSGLKEPAKVPHATITLTLEPVIPKDPTTADAGGHVVARHGGQKPPGSLSVATVVTDGNGDGYVKYASSEFAGKYELGAASEGASSAVDTVTVGIGLQALAPGAHFGFFGDTPGHPSNHSGTPRMNRLLTSLAGQFFEDNEVGLMFNDISLPLGGRFEVSDPPTQALTWGNLAHCDHRWGRGADVRTNTWQVDGYDKKNPSPEVNGMISKWLRLNPALTPKQAYFWEGDHLHLKTQ